MNIFKYAGLLASAGLVATMAAPPAFAGNLISGNGALSKNSIISQTCNTSVLGQTNKSFVYTSAFSGASSGGNKSNFNTGTGSSVTSGPSISNTTVAVGGSVNAAFVPPTCGECQPSTDNTISGNGAASWNSIVSVQSSSSVIGQSNFSSVMTSAGSEAGSGGNSSSGNTGGTSDVTTGGSSATTDVTVEGSQNLLNVGF